MSRAALLARAIDVHAWLEADRTTAIAERDLRDRSIGRQQSQRDDVGRVLNWWAQVGPQTGATSAGQRLAAVRRWLALALFGLGAVTGITLCGIALAYEGNYPVNLLALLGVLIGIPGLLLVLTVIAGLSQGMGLRALGDFLQSFNINRWVMGLWDRLSGERFSSSFGQANAQGTFAVWQLVSFSQQFGVGFFVGVLVTFGVLVAVTDLAFGWSTTLQVHNATVQVWVDAIAWPWAALLPAASPDTALVEASRFYRLAGVEAGDRAAVLGGWWPFVLMTIIVWGLLPRLLMLGFAQWRLAVATRSLLREHSEVTALLDRLATPAAAHAGEAEDGAATVAASVAPARSMDLEDAAVIVWNEAYPVNSQAGAVFAMSSLDSVEARIETLHRLPAGTTRLVVCTKSWEPPVLEFNDLLALLRAELGAAVSIVVAPSGVAGAPPAASEVAIWSRAVAQMGDPRVYVADVSRGHD